MVIVADSRKELVGIVALEDEVDEEVGRRGDDEFLEHFIFLVLFDESLDIVADIEEIGHLLG
ncbi:hypothetical protein RRF57_008658 [Xylaria bambusicola]|uniref:Uncharacterized protein n=1 Tax=Xylaria bambusicola TaxID=326684 RepID=A0AAN7Z0W7_9PEZI